MRIPFKSLFKEIGFFPILFIVILLAAPMEHMYDRLHRHLFYQYTNYPKQLVKSLYFYASYIILLAVFLYCFFQKKIKIKDFFFSSSNKYLMLFFFTVISSLLFSHFTLTIYHGMKLLYLFLYIFIFCLIVDLFKKKDVFFYIHLVLLSIFFLSLFECFLGIYQYFTQSPLGVHLLGEPKLHSKAFMPVGFFSEDGSLWIWDSIFSSYKERKFLFRAYGTLGHPNVLAGFIVLSIFSTFTLFSISQKRIYRCFFFISLLFQVFTIFLTFSRSALIALIVGASFWFYFKRSKVLIVGLISAVFLSGLILLPQLQSRGGYVNYNELVKSSDDFRITKQELAFKMIMDRPLLGVGYSCFNKSAEYYGGMEFGLVHNVYALIASETGLFGLMSFLMFLFCILRKAWRARKNVYCLSLFGIFVSLLVISCFDFYPIYFHPSLVWLFFLAALLEVGSCQILNQEAR